MRIATSTVYEQQANSINNLESQYQTIGQALSTGKSLNAPSDNPTQIGQDLGVHTSILLENQQAVNIQAATAQLTSTDSALANVTSLLQSARTLAERGASDILDSQERKAIGTEVDQYLQQAVALANTQYGGTYVFAGSKQQSTQPVTTVGSPTTSIAFTGNEQTQAPLLYNGESFQLSPTLQQSFNYTAANGSPDVFQVLSTLRDTLNNDLVVDQSAHSINLRGQVIYGNGLPLASLTPLGPVAGTAPSPFAVPPTPDNGNPPGYTISINNTDLAGTQHVIAYTFLATTAVDGAPLSVVASINANSVATGLTAAFNQATQRLSLTNAGGHAFYVTDEPSPGEPSTVAPTTSNFTTAFKLTGQADETSTVSTQLVDIDNVLDVVLGSRAVVGSRINALAQINDHVTSDINNNTAVMSGIEDTDIARATTQFSATQVALNASYSTTTRLESKHLFDYL